MSVASAMKLSARRFELDALLGALLDEGKADAGDGRRAVTASALGAAVDALTARTDERHRRGATVDAHRPPCRLDPLELLVEIDRTVGRHPGGRALAVRAWVLRLPDDLAVLEDAVHAVTAWLDAARALVEPPRTLALRGTACPVCGHAEVLVDGPAGEPVVTSALAVNLRTGIVSCLVEDCAAVWGADALHLLAATLDVQTTREVLALDG